MHKVPIKASLSLLIASVLAASVGYAWATQRGQDRACVPIAQYNTLTASSDLESLHQIQIDDVATLRRNLEGAIANDVALLWSSIQNESTSAEDRKHAYGMLRLIAVQNEKFPTSSLNSDPRVAVILQAAIKNDLAHTEKLRRQDWSKPIWDGGAK